MASLHWKEQEKDTFWKKKEMSLPGSIKPVYGAQHPPRHAPPITALSSNNNSQTSPNKNKGKNDSFQAFESKTNDAWDEEDDDLMKLAKLKINLQDVHASAQAVINNHIAAKSKSNGKDGNLESNPSSGQMIQHGPGRPQGPGLGVRLDRKPAMSFVKTENTDRDKLRVEKFNTVLHRTTDIDELKKLSWSGVPSCVRPMAWKILCGYVPASKERREVTLNRKRQEYMNYLEQYFDSHHIEQHGHTFRQIHIDVPRMNPLIPLFQHKQVQDIFERILFIWAIRHPASGYVQGMNDLVTPFFVVFLSEYINKDVETENIQVGDLPTGVLDTIEADSYWCMTKLLDGIQDNYTFAQPGIQTKVMQLADLIRRTDVQLHKHIEENNIQFLQFAFRWMNNLLMRELPLRCTIRLWDTYQSEVDGFASFHIYVCVALLKKFSSDLLREKDFQGLMMMLQNLPTHHWQDEDISLLLAEAYKLKYMFADAPNHLVQKR